VTGGSAATGAGPGRACSPLGDGGLSVEEESEEEDEEEEEDDNDKEEEEEEEESEKEEEMKLKKMEEQKTQSSKVRFPGAGRQPRRRSSGELCRCCSAHGGGPGRAPVLGPLWLCRSCSSRHALASWRPAHEPQLPLGAHRQLLWGPRLSVAPRERRGSTCPWGRGGGLPACRVPSAVAPRRRFP